MVDLRISVMMSIECCCVSVCVCVTGLMASAGGDGGGVDSKAELSALLEQWEREQQAGSSELLNILTK